MLELMELTEISKSVELLLNFREQERLGNSKLIDTKTMKILIQYAKQIFPKEKELNYLY